jgi:hypothetical protein
MIAIVVACIAASACSAVLGLNPPPSESAGGPDATTIDAGAEASSLEASGPGDGASDAASATIVCAPLDREDDAGSVYAPLSATDDDAGNSLWDSFDIANLPHPNAFSGGAFDGQYVYFAGRGPYTARYDTTAGFNDAGAWDEFDTSRLSDDAGTAGGFEGAVFDGRYVYFVPYGSATAPKSIVARFDTSPDAGGFLSITAWTSFDLAALMPDGGAPLVGYWGAAFDGRYVYFVPHNDGVPFGVVVRYDTFPPPGTPEGGATIISGLPHGDGGADAGDSGATALLFDELSQWQTFDLATINPTALGFLGAVYDGTALYLVPGANDAFNSELHSGNSGVAVRLRTAGTFTGTTAWSTMDLTTVNGLLTDFAGGAFDGQFVYFAPRGNGIAPRFDTTGSFTSVPSWSTYDLTRQFAPDAAFPTYEGAAFDGRFVYFIPVGGGFLSLTRYDTRSTYGADCAWSTIDLSQFGTGDAGPAFYSGALFDGKYLYLVPDGTYSVLRFNARSPPRQPMLPAYYGSFL